MKSVKLKVGNIIALSLDEGETIKRLEIVSEIKLDQDLNTQVKFKSSDEEYCSSGNLEVEIDENNLITTYRSGGHYYLVA